MRTINDQLWEPVKGDSFDEVLWEQRVYQLGHQYKSLVILGDGSILDFPFLAERTEGIEELGLRYDNPDTGESWENCWRIDTQTVTLLLYVGFSELTPPIKLKQ